ncbi:hypothetical protein OBRU01_10305, partial [Operophtera brumata]
MFKASKKAPDIIRVLMELIYLPTPLKSPISYRSLPKIDLGLIILLLGDGEERRQQHNVMRIRKRRLRDTNCPLELPEEDFVRLFRMTREVAVILKEGIEPMATHAFLRDNTVRRSLQPPYTGPYKILARSPTTIILDVTGKNHEGLLNFRVSWFHMIDANLVIPACQGYGRGSSGSYRAQCKGTVCVSETPLPNTHHIVMLLPFFLITQQ